MLTISGFAKSYDGKRFAVKDLDLKVEAGDLYAFIGMNGAGKTTTLRAAAGILPFERGKIEIAGRDIREQPIEAKRLLAYVPDQPLLYDNLTGLQYVNFIADVFGVSGKERRQKTLQYAEMLTIKNALNDPINSYSHGMKRKLEIIASLIHSPRLLLLDEPFVGLDPKASFTFKQLMRDFCAAGGAIFFSTHVLEVAEKLCNKVSIIKDGRLIKSGAMDEVRGDNSLEEVFLELTDHV
ncbi:MAG: ABC transporter ATP-binding protein [Clostridia bacterium]|nr:ABC transporter ATP-binding protein [Clostridia bacterium]